MELTISSDNSIRWEKPLEDSKFGIVALDVRRERTGLHAQINLTFKDTLLAYDTFNVGRNEERNRLAKSAHAMLGDNGTKDAYGLDFLKHDLDLFCRLLPDAHENGRFQIDHYDADEAVAPPKAIIGGYVLEGGGTILFAPPGQGKSYILQLMAGSVATGTRRFWQVEPRPVLVVNLERSGQSVRRRFYQIAKVLGIKAKAHQMFFLHAKGMSFTTIGKKLAAWKATHPDGMLAVDSISRSGLGSMNKDDVANEIVDFLNQFGTWLAIAHTPRADADHIYGSIHFDCGEDIGVKLTSDKILGSSTLGLCLEVVKANDMPIGGRQYLALDFTVEGLSAVRPATAREFPGLLETVVYTNHEKLVRFLMDVGEATASQASKETKVPRTTASTLFSGSDSFVESKRDKQKVYYKLKAAAEEDEPLPF